MSESKEYCFYSDSLQKTEMFGEILGKLLFPGAYVALTGELGSGKTAMAGAIAKGMGIRCLVTSPTYTIISEYVGNIPLYHFDAYRLENAEELTELGYWEYVEGEGVCLVEWADMFPSLYPDDYLQISIRYHDEKSRDIIFFVCGEKYIEMLEGFLHVYSGAGDVDTGCVCGFGGKQ